MEASDWASFGLRDDEGTALLRQADEIAEKMTYDPDVRADLRQEALKRAANLLLASKAERDGDELTLEMLRSLDPPVNPPDGMPGSGLARLRWLRTPMWRAANRFNTRKAFDTPLGHDGLPHSELQMVELNDSVV